MVEKPYSAVLPVEITVTCKYYEKFLVLNIHAELLFKWDKTKIVIKLWLNH